ncbi:MAG: (2Fe-2S) ferredoxin domain-containing protein [Clostridia bacterium]|nr:(2Fe-2S) ferredoxin domain-containing protein [Clostridia bacterium]
MLRSIRSVFAPLSPVIHIRYYIERKKTMKITVCIGSSCHIKGSRQVVEQLQALIAANNLGDKVDLGGTFCMGECQKGVCVTVDDSFHSVTPDTVESFFQNEVLAKV